MEVTSLGELRALRDSYRAGAIRALESRWRKPMGAFVDECARHPVKHRCGVEALAQTVCVMADWAALTRFIWLAELVWEAESEALACLPPFACHQKRRAA